MRQWQSMTVCAALVCAFASCSDDTTGNSGAEGERYVLRSVAGNSLPAVIIVGDYTSWEIVADTMRFGADGYGTEVVIQRPVYPDAPPGPVTRDERGFQYRMVAGKLEIEFPCPDFASQATQACIGPPHYQGYLTMDGIVFDLALSHPTPFRFQRRP